ncbi:MAG: hypothetical protein LUC41_04765 [Clostridiales bacterium]|nr:hypothetical protein [Clostridiales bacterium]
MYVLICSLTEIEWLDRLPFRCDAALISIDGLDMEPPKLDYQPKYYLRQEFEDVWLSEVGYEDSGSYAFSLFSMEQAKEMAEFIYGCKDDIDVLICQCRSGVSRSAGVAAAVREHFSHDGIEVFLDRDYSPNVFVFQYLYRALEDMKK